MLICFSVDNFTIEAVDVGEVKEVGILRDTSGSRSEWHLRKVRRESQKSGLFVPFIAHVS